MHRELPLPGINDDQQQKIHSRGFYMGLNESAARPAKDSITCDGVLSQDAVAIFRATFWHDFLYLIVPIAVSRLI
jgi:hypothetical protein